MFQLSVNCEHAHFTNYKIFAFTGESLHVPPLDRPYKPRILSHYPEDVAHNPFDAAAVCMVTNICFLFSANTYKCKCPILSISSLAQISDALTVNNVWHW